MDYKRLEIYVGWTCNQKCTYCMEFPNMEEAWNKKVTKYDILKKLIKYKKLGYNHVTYLGGEPFIQPVFLDALKIGKKLGYTILVTTNCTTLHIDSQASKYLPYIDELIISFEAIDKELQQKISRTNVFVDWEKVFENIKKYWNGKMLKANIVITQDNLLSLFDIVKYLNIKEIKNISITYPDIPNNYYTKNHIITRVAPKYSECISSIIPIINYTKKNGIKLSIVDIPYCIFPKENLQKYIKITDDYDYQGRLKISHQEKKIEHNGSIDKFGLFSVRRNEKAPRRREYIDKCIMCKYKNKCWGISSYYETLYGLDEINPIIK